MSDHIPRRINISLYFEFMKRYFELSTWFALLTFASTAIAASTAMAAQRFTDRVSGKDLNLRPVIASLPEPGTLVLQTLPISCEVSISGLEWDKKLKVQEVLRVKNLAAGTYTATFEAMGRTVKTNVVIRSGDNTVLWVDLISGQVENRSTWTEANDAIDTGKGIDFVEGAAEGIATNEEALRRSDADAASLKNAIARLDEKLGSGLSGLEEIHLLLGRRTDLAHALAKAEITRQSAAQLLKEERQGNFVIEYKKFRDVVEASANLPEALKETIVQSSWHDLIENWKVENPPAAPVPLYWSNGAVNAVSSPEGGKNVFIPGLELELIWLAPGEFTLGSPDNESGRDIDEGPQTRVSLTKGFWMGKYEVTQAQWNEIMGANLSRFSRVGAEAPVDQVTWEEAIDFCQKVSIREQRAGRLPEGYFYTLPTEAQWDYAARGGKTDSNVGKLDDIAWFQLNSKDSTHRVGQKLPNAWDLYDLIGNVSEWCFDWKDEYPGNRVVDYCGPSSGSLKVYRGGNCLDSVPNCRISLRSGGDPTTRIDRVGFRICLREVRK